MATLEINGRDVEVDDSFLSLSPADQEATVDEIAQSLGASTPQPETFPTSSGEAYRRNFFDGIPVVGPLIRGGVERAAAGVVSALDPNRTYEDVRASQEQRAPQLSANHPTASTLGSVSGTVAGTMPMIAAAPAFFGASGPAALRLAMAPTSGGLLGAADAGVRSGGDRTEMAQGGLLGAALGLTGLGASELLGSGASAFTRWLSGGKSTPAQRKFVEAITRDNVDDVAGAMQKVGPDAMPLDVGPNTRNLGQGVVTVPGPGRTIVEDAVKARDVGANSRISTTLDDTLGKAKSPSQLTANIEEQMGRLGPSYDEALRGAKPAYTANIAKKIDDMANNLRGNPQKAAQRVRSMLNETGKDSLDKNARTLLETRRGIDGMMETADGPTKSALTMMRHQIDQELSRAVPGIKGVDAQYHELARQREALVRGQQVLDSGRTAPRPAELAEEFNSGGVPEGQLVGPSGVPQRLREGSRAEIERIIGTNANDRVALQRLIKGEGDWNRDRLAILFGKEKAEKIIGLLDREKGFAETSTAIRGNSETAKRLEGVATVKGEGGNALKDAMNTNFGTAAARMGDKLFGDLNAAARDAMSKELGQLLTGPAGTSAKIKAIQAAQRRGDIAKDVAKKIITSLSAGSAGKLVTE